MIWQNELQHVASEVVNSPRLLAASAATTSALSIAEIANIVTGWITTSGILLGAVATALLIRVHWVKYKNEVITNRLLLRQLADLEEKDAS